MLLFKVQEGRGFAPDYSSGSELGSKCLIFREAGLCLAPGDFGLCKAGLSPNEAKTRAREKKPLLAKHTTCQGMALGSQGLGADAAFG